MVEDSSSSEVVFVGDIETLALVVSASFIGVSVVEESEALSVEVSVARALVVESSETVGEAAVAVDSGCGTFNSEGNLKKFPSEVVETSGKSAAAAAAIVL